MDVQHRSSESSGSRISWPNAQTTPTRRRRRIPATAPGPIDALVCSTQAPARRRPSPRGWRGDPRQPPPARPVRRGGDDQRRPVPASRPGGGAPPPRTSDAPRYAILNGIWEPVWVLVGGLVRGLVGARAGESLPSRSARSATLRWSRVVRSTTARRRGGRSRAAGRAPRAPRPPPERLPVTSSPGPARSGRSTSTTCRGGSGTLLGAPARPRATRGPGSRPRSGSRGPGREDEQTAQHAKLRGSQPDADRVVHDGDHPRRLPLQLGAESR